MALFFLRYCGNSLCFDDDMIMISLFLGDQFLVDFVNLMIFF